MTKENLKSDFINDASAHLEATLKGDFKTANKLHSKLMRLYKKVKESKDESQYLGFLKDINEGVCLWAATFLLRTHTEAAVACLKKLSSSPSIISMDAKMILEMWDKGELELL